MKKGYKITNEQIYEWIKSFDTRIQTINDRTKSHTLDIKKIEKQLKELLEVKRREK